MFGHESNLKQLCSVISLTQNVISTTSDYTAQLSTLTPDDIIIIICSNTTVRLVFLTAMNIVSNLNSIN